MISVIGFSCNNSETTNVPTTPVPSTTTTPIEPVLTPTVAHIELPEIEQLLVQSEKVDYILYNYSFSLNIGQKEEVAKHVAMIYNQPVENVDCAAALGKVEFYDKDMKVLKEAQIHFGNNCAYYIFYDKDGKKKYANKMHSNGIRFLNNVIQQHNKPQE